MKTFINAIKAYMDARNAGKLDKVDFSPEAAKDDMTQKVGIRNGKLWTKPFVLTGKDITDTLGFYPVNEDLIGAENGIATLDENGKVPVSQIPAKDPDTVLEGKMEVIPDRQPYYYEVYSGDGELSMQIALPVRMKNNAFYRSELEIKSLPYGVEEIGDYAFDGCQNLKLTELPANLRKVGSSAFSWARGLRLDHLPEKLESIGNSAFWNCTEIQFQEIPETVQLLDTRAFDWCIGLTEVSLPKGLTRIGSAPFCRCANLITMTMDEDNPNYCTVDGTLFDKAVTRLIQYPCGKSGAYIVPESVISLGDSAFYEAKKLTDISLPDGLTEIGIGCFMGCSGLRHITIPSGVSQLPYSAIRECINLEELTLQEGLTHIGEDAIRYCLKLKRVELPASVARIDTGAFTTCPAMEKIWIRSGCTSMADGIFEGCTKLTIYCEAESKPDGWGTGFNRLSSSGTETIPVVWGVTARPW